MDGFANNNFFGVGLLTSVEPGKQRNWTPNCGHLGRNLNPQSNPTKLISWFIISRGIIISVTPIRVDSASQRQTAL